MDWSDFADAAGLPPGEVTSMWFRHKMSQLLMAQRDILLAECEEYALCHGDQIRKTKYQSELSKKAKSLVGQGWYGAAVEPREHSMMKEKKDIWVGKDQQKRFQQEDPIRSMTFSLALQPFLQEINNEGGLKLN